MIDDLGWSDVGFHNSVNHNQTPFLDTLILKSLQLDRYYTHSTCSPSRASLQTGQNPMMVNTVNVLPQVYNSKDNTSGFQGVPLDRHTIAQVLQKKGYSTHYIGKWDLGMATKYHMPNSKGYDSWLGYWHHSNDHWSFLADDAHCNYKKLPDIWHINNTYNGPATWTMNEPHCCQQGTLRGTPTPPRGIHEKLYSDADASSFLKS